jgi:hypothetical protein
MAEAAHSEGSCCSSIATRRQPECRSTRVRGTATGAGLLVGALVIAIGLLRGSERQPSSKPRSDARASGVRSVPERRFGLGQPRVGRHVEPSFVSREPRRGRVERLDPS